MRIPESFAVMLFPPFRLVKVFYKSRANVFLQAVFATCGKPLVLAAFRSLRITTLPFQRTKKTDSSLRSE
jgi:hypothetical protein